jgi:hypothetical protein
MDLKIQHDQENKGELPFHSLPIFQLFCEQIGFQSEWNQQEKILHLTSHLRGKKFYFIPMKQNDTHTSMLENIKAFLKKTAMEIVELPAKSSLPNDGEIILKSKSMTSSNNTASLPKFMVLHSYGTKAKKWAESFRQECINHGFAAQIKEDEYKSSIPFLEIRLKLPKTQEMDKQFGESISLILASSLLRGLTKDNPFLLFPFLSPELMKFLLPTEKKSNSLESTPVLEKVPYSEISDKNNGKNVPSTTPKPTLLPPFRMEACFDYQFVFPTSEDDDYLILGNMYCKNTGLGALTNPHICIQVNPKDQIQLKGQIVPPNMTDTVGVQSFSGESAVGWRYVDDDWLKKVKDQGEYWICPIQPMTILPGETLTFPNFQFTIPNKMNGDITIQGSVHYHQLKLQFPTTNRITLSFP